MKPLLSRLLSRTFAGVALAATLAGATITSTAMANDVNEPKITIYHTEDKTFYEYTRDGEVLEIKVVPKKGKPYYLVPAGDEDEGFREQTESSLRVPKWVIFSW